MAETTVKVVVRCRPLLPHETDKDVKNVSTIDEDGGRITISSRTHDYGNESVVGGGDRHATMYDRTAKPLIAQLFDGYNATVLAYGQTGSGKTHTMGTAFDEAEVDGVVPRAVAEIISRREKLISEGRGCLIVCSMCEVYQEEVRDLLMECDEEEGPKALAVREAPNGGGVTIAGLSEREVSSIEAVVALTREGTRRRMTAATNMNEHSSRSHMILSFRVEVAGGEGRSKTSSKLHLVDLAGSERVKRTQAEGTRLQEGIEINKSLFMLGNVIQRLVELQSSEKRKGGHVPYRDSTLTRLLSDSLGGTAHTCMVACFSPGDVDVSETLNTLRWADKASVVKNVAVRRAASSRWRLHETTSPRRRRRGTRVHAFRSRAGHPRRRGPQGRKAADRRTGGTRESAGDGPPPQVRRRCFTHPRRNPRPAEGPDEGREEPSEGHSIVKEDHRHAAGEERRFDQAM